MDTIKLNSHHYTDLKGLKIDGSVVTAVAVDYIYVSGRTGELDALMGDAATVYVPVIRADYAMELVSFTVRTEAKETTANATMDVLKAASATAMASGTAMVTQKDPDTLTDATDAALTVKTDASEDLAVGDMVVFKVVSGAATSELKNLAYTAKFHRL